MARILMMLCIRTRTDTRSCNSKQESEQIRSNKQQQISIGEKVAYVFSPEHFRLEG
jgi:hypothetical protein